MSFDDAALGDPPVRRPRWQTERRWGTDARPLARRWITSEGVARPPTKGGTPFDFCGAMRRLCADVTARCPEVGHIDMSRVLVTVTPSRNRSAYGLQARVTPMRFRDGTLDRRHRGVVYRVQRYFVDGREVLYVVTFCLPRFLDQTFEEKLVTVFHELYHVGPRFDGDLRRHPGRYAVHSHSKRGYDERMGELVSRYLVGHPSPAVFDFLHFTHAGLCRRYGGVVGVVVPRPKLLPVG